MLSYTNAQIVSVTELQNKFKSTRERVAAEGYLAVFNSNKPDVIIADIEYFEKLLQAEEKCEQMEMYLAVQLAKARNKLVPLELSEFD